MNKKLGKRAFVLGLEPWTSLVQRLDQNFGSGAEVILFGIGKSYGMSAAQEEKRTEADPQVSIEFLGRMATIAGWGKITIRRDSPEKFVVKVGQCVFCAGINDVKKKQIPCFFLRGVISGFAEVLLLSATKIDEIHCDSDYCEFTVELRQFHE